MNHKHFCFLLFLLLVCRETSDAGWLARSGNEGNKYDVKNIPALLLKDAEAVVRANITCFEVKNERRAVETRMIAVTVFTKEKRDYGYLSLGYDKFHEIEDLEGTLYDARGEKIRTLDNDEIKDHSAISGYTLYNDSRVRLAEMYYDQYPYTIEYTVKYSFDGYLGWPSWQSQTSFDPVEHARFEIRIPKGDSLRFWCSRDSIQPAISLEGSKKLYLWEAKNLPRLSKDVVGNDPEDYATIVRIAPSLFQYDKYPGDMRTWKDFGAWDYSLTMGRDVLPESAIQDVHTLLKPVDDVREKIKKLYRYMQVRTRYIDVQLGVGGWQPFDASYVHERGYGDCKALSNYMVALLKEAGIPAYAVSIRSGDYRYPFIKEFPSAQFNHVIACVPLLDDTVWLECTSQSIPFGHIGENNENRGALLLSPQGGIPVQTPRSTPLQNLQKRTTSIHLSPFGFGEVLSVVSSRGNQQDNVRQALHDASAEERERWILNNLGVQNANLQKYTIEGMEEHTLEVTLSVQISLPRFASVSGNRLFFVPNLMQRQTYIPPDVALRASPVRYDYPYLDTDSLYYFLPEDYTIESIPKEIVLESSFGSYRSRTIVLGDTAIIYLRSKEIREYSIPAKNYPEYRKFHGDIVKADKAQVVLVRKK